LAICQRLVNLMGGELQLASVPGRGSRFHFQLTFPVLGGNAVVPAGVDVIHRVLIVDDNSVARELLEGMAHSLGWEADVAASGEDALALLGAVQNTQRHYDALFIDWRMPGMDGWETSQRIRSLAGVGNAPVLVMVTAHGRAMLAQRSAADRALLDGFLVKPVTASMLADAVAEALGRPLSDPPRTAVAAASCPLAGLRLLVVEDNANNQQVARELLTAQGASVDIAVNGLDGVKQVLAAQPPYDVVLMDVQMPVMDGYVATRVLRQEHGLTRLPIVAMTANAMASDRDECLAAGMTDHVGKPFDLDHLVATLLRHAGAATANSLAEGGMDVAAVPLAPSGAEAGGIDVAAAVARFGGDDALYRKMFPSFCTDIVNLADQLAARVQTGAHDESAALLHTLKGLAATMGATGLAGLVQDAEAAWGRTGVAPNEAMAAALQAGVRDAIARIDAQLQATPARGSAAPLTTQPPPDLEAPLQRLVTLLEGSDMDALSLYESIRPGLVCWPASELAALDAAMETLDFAGALRVCVKQLGR
jgi:CheY-like chemotaxis protein/HPt (histidine-containing phosphotransfer) domain-containing protein